MRAAATMHGLARSSRGRTDQGLTNIDDSHNLQSRLGGGSMTAVNIVGRWLTIVLIAGVSACGGGGGGSSGPGPSKVFAADEVNGGVGSTENSNPTPGTQIAITRIITGVNTQIPVGPGCSGCLPSLALDSSRDQLYVSTSTNILVFNNAGTATGNIAPSRVVG